MRETIEGLSQLRNVLSDASNDCQSPVSSGPNLARSINIKQLNHGYVVEVGCQTFAIESKEKLSTYLAAYLADPAGTEKKWYNGTLGL